MYHDDYEHTIECYESLLDIACYYEHKGDIAKAKEYFERVLVINSYCIEAKSALKVL